MFRLVTFKSESAYKCSEFQFQLERSSHYAAPLDTLAKRTFSIKAFRGRPEQLDSEMELVGGTYQTFLSDCSWRCSPCFFFPPSLSLLLFFLLVYETNLMAVLSNSVHYNIRLFDPIRKAPTPMHIELQVRFEQVRVLPHTHSKKNFLFNNIFYFSDLRHDDHAGRH